MWLTIARSFISRHQLKCTGNINDGKISETLVVVYRVKKKMDYDEDWWADYFIGFSHENS